VLLFYFLRQINLRTRTTFLCRPEDEGAVPWMLSEYGGFGWYRVKSQQSQLELIREYTRDIVAEDLFCGYCYTQLYDVERETNGLLTFDRVSKLPMEEIRVVNSMEAPRR
jgi:hypothetical protein